MNPARVAAALDQIGAQEGLHGAALVEAGTGLVWHASGSLGGALAVWEAAVDYWRLHGRQQQHFAGLGALRVAAMYHDQGVLAMFPCGRDPELLAVVVGRHHGVDWIDLQRRVRELGAVLERRT